MAIMRIGFAAIALYYIAPHIGGEALKNARPVVEQAKSSLHTSAISSAALQYCQTRTDECLKLARGALVMSNNQDMPQRHAKQNHVIVPINAAIRGTLPINPPLPPVRTP